MSFDLIIRNGIIVDGTGNPWFHGDLAITSGRIQVLGKVSSDAEFVIEANGLIVAPGFIDAHSHSDSDLHNFPLMENSLIQGITTVIAGNCGWSPAPITSEMKTNLEKQYSKFRSSVNSFRITWTTFNEYLLSLQNKRIAGNFACNVGHNTIRVAIMGFESREPNSSKLNEMRKLTKEAMSSGAFGLSTGLIYPPGMFAMTYEIVELAKVVAEFDGVYTSHIRGENMNLIPAVKEAIDIGEKAQVPVHISHHKAGGKHAWGKSSETLHMMNEARKRGIDVTFDQYPYRAGSTSLSVLLPPWVHNGGVNLLLERLQNFSYRKRIEDDITSSRKLLGWENFAGELGWKNIVISHVKSEKNKKFEGKNLFEVKTIRNDPDEFTTLFNLLIEERGNIQTVIFAMKEEDIKLIMKNHLQMVGTDSFNVQLTGQSKRGKPHPRHFGTFPRILGKYVREYGVLRLEDAVRRMTSFPAQTFGIHDRGLLLPGMWADITIFDPENIIDKATYENPYQSPQGIIYVIVNGKITLDKGKFTEERGGKILRKNQPESAQLNKA